MGCCVSVIYHSPYAAFYTWYQPTVSPRPKCDQNSQKVQENLATFARPPRPMISPLCIYDQWIIHPGNFLRVPYIERSRSTVRAILSKFGIRKSCAPQAAFSGTSLSLICKDILRKAAHEHLFPLWNRVFGVPNSSYLVGTRERDRRYWFRGCANENSSLLTIESASFDCMETRTSSSDRLGVCSFPPESQLTEVLRSRGCHLSLASPPTLPQVPNPDRVGRRALLPLQV